MSQPTERLHKYDVIRCLLLFLVLLGHEIELFRTGWAAELYRVIYSFHMPAFLYISGRFARFDGKKILRHLCLPYLVFQPLYLCFAAFVLTGAELEIQYTTPYWILWYLPALIFSYCLLPFLPEKGKPAAAWVIAGSVVVAVLVGYDTTVGSYLALSRFLVFLPFFLWGYYGQSIRILPKLTGSLRRVVFLLLSLAVIALSEYYILHTQMPVRLLFGSRDYEYCRAGALGRVIAMAAAAGWIGLLEAVVPNRKLPLLSTLGRNTMPVFLLHAFVVRLLEKYNFFCYSQKVNLLLAGALAVAMLLVLGNDLVGKIFRKLF